MKRSNKIEGVPVITFSTIKEYEEAYKEVETFLPIFVRNGDVIIGPLKNSEPSQPCLKCCLTKLDENVMEDKGELVFSSPSKQFHHSLIQGLADEMIRKGNKATVYLFNGIQNEVHCLSMIRTPQCSVCVNVKEDHKKSRSMKSSQRVSKANYRIRSFEELKRVITVHKDTLINFHCGLINRHYRGIASSMPLLAFAAHVGKRSFDSYGRTDNYENSYFTGVLEALERYSGVYPFYPARWLASEIDLQSKKEKFISMDAFLHYTDEQYDLETFELEPYRKEDRIYWRRAYSSRNGEYKLVPEQVFYFSTEKANPDHKEKGRYIYESSNGTAVGSTFEEATIGALCEYIERDSFFVHWYNKVPPKKLKNIDALGNQNIHNMLLFLEYLEFDVHLFDITLETRVPTIWVLLENRSSKNEMAFYTAAGANFNPEAALESALIEAVTAIQVFSKVIQNGGNESKKRQKELLRDFNKVADLQDHLLLYASRDMKKHLAFAIESSNIVSFKDAYEVYYQPESSGRTYTQSELADDLIDRILQFHDDVLIHEMRNDALDLLDLHCVKVVIPSMLTISFGHQYRSMNRDRIFNSAKINGLKRPYLTEEEINLVPHPFP